MRANKVAILEANKEVGRCFARAYRFLRAAQDVYNDWEIANLEGMDFASANRKAAATIKEIFSTERNLAKIGKMRHLFASAITPDGPVNYLGTVVGPCKYKYILKGEPGTGKSTLLRKVATAAVEKGYDVEVYHCSLDPNKFEHVVIPELNVALTTSEKPHSYPVSDDDKIIDMNECLSPATVKKYAAIAEYDQNMYYELFTHAISFIRQAKLAHDRMETYYVPNMDFAAIGQLWEKTMARILKYAEEVKKE